MTMAGQVSTPTEVRYPIPHFVKPSKRAQYFLIGVNVLFVAMTVWWIARGRIPFTPILALLAWAYSWWRIHSRGRDAVADRKSVV